MPYIETAIRAAREAGDIINQASRSIETINVQTKAFHDYVTDVDRASERAIVDILTHYCPSHAVLSEECGLMGQTNSEFVWVVDPIDGTTNFIHGFPQYAVSIALRRGNDILEAVVYDPLKDEMFTAVRGEGARLNKRRIRVSGRIDLSSALIGTGFPFREGDDFEGYAKVFTQVARRTSGIRRAGAASLDLCYVACGRLDAFWETGLKSWDVAAGSLIVLEARGLVTDLDGNDGYLDSGRIVAGTPKILGALMPILNGSAPVQA
ncbi:inositol monophosphatase [Mesosutterella sp. OilRF-GAM-744-9]|uniref:Inositol-1-monophosphatase n=1 Tax=Mesosutterella porci TaxID=2915351 RepID=A0ABS9MPY1_9BURK|nr:inositol monophosphatase family protein [Mesosutterella sp. oilRF-744-WT-GAM-9]MCG5030457.1 inositol monophosphatase [Mesosutterella sp. oilRF-744-WT-GAM-9]MCI6530577.1 inositol monophosphatase [Mesosutterella sp.]